MTTNLLRPTRLAIVEACLIGLAAGVCAVAVKQGVASLSTFRLHGSEILPLSLPGWLYLSMFGLIGGMAAGWLVERVAPETSGSGIPQVKAVLQGAAIKFDVRVAVVKMIGGILALGCGMPLGREGPTVQIGAALAAQCERWMPISPKHRRQLISAGAGAGLAAAFNAPIAGVLFVLEELLKDVSGSTLGAAVLACVVASTVSQGGGGAVFDIKLDSSLASTGFLVQEIPFYILLGTAAGLLGAAFNQGILASLTWNFKTIRAPVTIRVALAGLITGAITGMLPSQYHSTTELRHLIVNAEASAEVAAVAFALQFILTLITYGSGAPGGLFAPTLLLGSSLGYLTGLLSRHALGAGAPATFALAGMGAFFSGAIRVPITAIVIVFEMTGDFNLVLPLMISCIVAWFVGEKASPGALYDRLMDWGSLVKPVETAKEPAPLITVGDIMHKEFADLPRTATIGDAANILAGSAYLACAVMDDGGVSGIVTKADLALVVEKSLPLTAPVTEIMSQPAEVLSPDEPLDSAIRLLVEKGLSLVPVKTGDKLVGLLTLTDILRKNFLETPP